MRNRIDDELQHIRKEARTVKFALPAHSTYEALLKQHQLPLTQACWQCPECKWWCPSDPTEQPPKRRRSF